jgi:hypothetical protein
MRAPRAPREAPGTLPLTLSCHPLYCTSTSSSCVCPSWWPSRALCAWDAGALQKLPRSTKLGFAHPWSLVQRALRSLAVRSPTLCSVTRISCHPLHCTSTSSSCVCPSWWPSRALCAWDAGALQKLPRSTKLGFAHPWSLVQPALRSLAVRSPTFCWVLCVLHLPP